MRAHQVAKYVAAAGMMAAISLMAAILHRQTLPVVHPPRHVSRVQLIRPAAPPASAPLLTREAWLMHWQPAWYRSQWVADGRPPILWSPQQASYYVKGFATLLTFPGHWELLPASAFPSWYGRPLRP